MTSLFDRSRAAGRPGTWTTSPAQQQLGSLWGSHWPRALNILGFLFLLHDDPGQRTTQIVHGGLDCKERGRGI